jgi:hypothetical protein
MRELQRPGACGDVKGKLIAAARAERMPLASRRRALGVAVGVSVTKLASASVAPPALLGGTFWKCAAAVVGTAVLTATVHGVVVPAFRGAGGSTHSVEGATRPDEPSPVASPSRIQPTEVRGDEESATSHPAPALLSGAPRRPAAPLRPVSSASMRAPPASHSLAGEIAAVDRAKRALASGDASGAMRELDAYELAFAHGALLPEAQALRIEALARSGRNAEARARLDAFRAEHPDSPLLEALSLIAQ